MYKILFILGLLLSNLSANEENNESKLAIRGVGAIVSYGEGSGFLYRSYGESYYIQHAGYALGYKDQGNADISVNYGLSYGKYLYSPRASYYHMKAVLGLDLGYHYSESTYDNYTYDETTGFSTVSGVTHDIYEDKFAILSGGFGIELGQREMHSVMLSLELLYMFRYEGKEKYGFYPSGGASVLFNF